MGFYLPALPLGLAVFLAGTVAGQAANGVAAGGMAALGAPRAAALAWW